MVQPKQQLTMEKCMLKKNPTPKNMKYLVYLFNNLRDSCLQVSSHKNTHIGIQIATNKHIFNTDFVYFQYNYQTRCSRGRSTITFVTH